MVGETRYLDIGEIESSEAGVSDYLPLTTDYSGDCSASEEETVTKSPFHCSTSPPLVGRSALTSRTSAEI